MNMEIPTINQSSSFEANNEIEVLDDFDIPKEEKQELPNNPMTSNPSDVMPFFFNNTQNPTPTENKIEEIRETSSESIIDPMASVIKLDPNYEEKQKEVEGMDLKTAINDVREFVNTLQNKGFEVAIDEIDLENTYQITINVKK